MRTFKLIAKAKEDAQTIENADEVDDSKDGELVCISGPIITEEELVDPLFSCIVKGEALKLERTVYEFTETEGGED